MQFNGPVSSTMKNRKASKPLMEKKRRARFNASLAELETLLAETKKQENIRQNKMEKADILEMTVRYVKQLQSPRQPGPSTDDSQYVNKYSLGFNKCAHEVGNFLKSVDGLNPDIHMTILQHLADRNRPKSNLHMTDTTMGTPQGSVKYSPYDINNNSTTATTTNVVTGNNQSNVNVSHDNGICRNVSIHESLQSNCVQGNANIPGNTSQNVVNSVCQIPNQGQIISNNSSVFNGLQLMPTKLTTGQIAFIIPATNVIQGNPVQNYVIPCNVMSNVQVGQNIVLNSSSSSLATQNVMVGHASTSSELSHKSMNSNTIPPSNTENINFASDSMTYTEILPLKETGETMNISPMEANNNESKGMVYINTDSNNEAMPVKQTLPRHIYYSKNDCDLHDSNTLKLQEFEKIDNRMVSPTMWRPW